MTAVDRTTGSAPGAAPSTPTAPRAPTTEHLANERTFLAWIRTCIAIIGLGFVMAKFSVWLREFMSTIQPTATVPRVGASLPAGITLIAFGALIAALAYQRYHSAERAIEDGRYVPARGLLILTAAAVVFVSIAIVAYLIMTTDTALTAR